MILVLAAVVQNTRGVMAVRLEVIFSADTSSKVNKIALDRLFSFTGNDLLSAMGIQLPCVKLNLILSTIFKLTTTQPDKADGQIL